VKKIGQIFYLDGYKIASPLAVDSVVSFMPKLLFLLLRWDLISIFGILSSKYCL